MHLNFELNLAFRSPELVGKLDALLEGYYAAATEVRFETFIRRSLWKRLKESTFRPLGPIL